jgi:hypothetical protein
VDQFEMRVNVSHSRLVCAQCDPPAHSVGLQRVWARGCLHP